MVVSVRRTSNCLCQYPLTTKAISWKSRQSHPREMPEIQPYHMDLSSGKAATWSLV